MSRNIVMVWHHDLGLVVLSILMSILAAFAAREFLGLRRPKLHGVIAIRQIKHRCNHGAVIGGRKRGADGRAPGGTDP
jgi:hypothetical protein